MRSSPRNGEGAAPQRRPSPTTYLRSPAPLHSTPQQRLFVARAEAYPPAGRRSKWLLLVKNCVFCGYAHAHRGGADGGLRSSGCRRGEYILLPVVAGQAVAA